jgi:hypothetical protein
MARSGPRISAIFASRPFPVRPVRFRLQHLGALLHRSAFLVRESLGLLADRGGARAGLLPAFFAGFLSAIVSPVRELVGRPSLHVAESRAHARTAERQVG